MGSRYLKRNMETSTVNGRICSRCKKRPVRVKSSRFGNDLCNACWFADFSAEREPWRCRTCPNPRAPDRSQCLSCLERQRESHLRQRQALSAVGLCQCGRKPERLGYKTCSGCLLRGRNRRRAIKEGRHFPRARKRAASPKWNSGTCTNQRCQETSFENHNKCVWHYPRPGESGEQRRARLTLAGFCHKCFQVRLVEVGVLCDRCLERNRIDAHKYKQRHGWKRKRPMKQAASAVANTTDSAADSDSQSTTTSHSGVEWEELDHETLFVSELSSESACSARPDRRWEELDDETLFSPELVSESIRFARPTRRWEELDDETLFSVELVSESIRALRSDLGP